MPIVAQTVWSATGRLDPVYEPERAAAQNVALAPGTYQRGTVIGEITATPGTYRPYAAANADGSQNPAMFLMYDTTVDASGNVSLGRGNTGGEFGQTFGKAAPAYMSGYFRTQELVGLDANAVTRLAGRLLQGTVASGIILI